jgi:hypothetical protein
VVTIEQDRLRQADEQSVPWRRWGPYLSERQWGTVREDYSAGGDAWSSFTHDQARSRAYRWGEDGIAGISDDQQLLCFALAFWNGNDPILKERLFGLTNSEGNHGEDVKEYYFYVDATPTSSYLQMIYKYPQREYPYDDLVRTNHARSRQDFEYELLDTGVFDDNRYFDIVVEYAKVGPEDLLANITVDNRGPEDAELHLLPTIWFRHTWSWAGGTVEPVLRRVDGLAGLSAVMTEQSELGNRWLYAEGDNPVLVTGNETNNERVFDTPNEAPYVKDAFHRYVIQGDPSAVDPSGVGTKAAIHYTLNVPAGGSATVRLRLTDTELVKAGTPAVESPFGTFDAVMQTRRRESDEFWDGVLGTDRSEDERRVLRQALSGMLWSKQYYGLDIERWLVERGADPLGANIGVRNAEWRHLAAHDVISMPDKWEYPWFAAWDLAFHAVALAPVDMAFAKQQLALLLQRPYMHPNGQLPAYEWNFSDVNPPVHAWAVWLIYQLEKVRTGTGDRVFLENAFLKLGRYFSWWLNRKDADDRNVFQGGFLGLDNVGVFDRSAPLPGGGRLDQADGTAWMALFSTNMVQMALELAKDDPIYIEQAQALFENFAWIAAATGHVGPDGVSMWDDEDGFFYDVLRHPDGSGVPLRVRSVVGLMPLAAATVLDGAIREQFPELVKESAEFLADNPAVAAALLAGRELEPTGPVLFALFDETRLRRILSAMLDESEFLSPHGIRSLSRRHKDHPFVFTMDGQDHTVAYLPAESDSGMFGGNSNWRGPVWLPMNALMVRALLNLHAFFGDAFTIECPTGSGRQCTLYEVAHEINTRLLSTFLRSPDGQRPIHGGQRIFQEDPNWRDLLLFYEYLHGDNGAGLGASHQTGWTGLVGVLPLLFEHFSAADVVRQRSGEGVQEGTATSR